MCPTGDLNKYESAISRSTCISLLYEFMKILISANEYLLLLYTYSTRVSMYVYTYKSYVPLLTSSSSSLLPFFLLPSRMNLQKYPNERPKLVLFGLIS